MGAPCGGETERLPYFVEGHFDCMAKKILVIEDEKDSRFVLICQLRFIGYEPLEAATAEQGLERATTEQPDLILMDLAMPNLTGVEIAKILKQNSATAHIPIVAYTAWEHTLWKEPALQAGMVEYLIKPVTPDVLKATIERFTTG
jgi:putative two-component system response regulator